MKQLYEKAQGNNETTVVMVLGDAGLGKTRLSVEFLKNIRASYRGVRVVFVRGDSLRQGSYHVLSQIITEIIGKGDKSEVSSKIEEILRKRDDLSEAEVKTFKSLLVSMIYPSGNKHEGGVSVLRERVNAVITLLSGIFSGSENPFIIVVDDFHHVDEDSMSILSKVKDYIPHSRVMFVFNSRRGFSKLNSDRVVELKPVSKNAVYAFVRSILSLRDERISGEFVDLIMEKTGGNPYYIEELVKYIAAKGLYEENPVRVKEEAFHLPETLISILTEKIDAMPEELKEVVKIAACVGRTFWEGVLEIILGREVEPFLLSLEEKGLITKETKSMIENDMEYVFVHELLRDAAYALLTKKERTKLHNIIGGILELYENNATLLYDAARHFEAARDEEKADKLFEKAGDLSKKQANFRFALKCYECVKNTSPELLLKKAEVLEILSEYDKATEVIERGLHLFGDDNKSDLYQLFSIRLASIKEKQGDFNNALVILEKLENIRNPVLRAEVLGRVAWAHFRVSNYEKSVEIARRAFAIIDRLNQTNPEVLIRKGLVLNVLANVYTKKGELDKAYRFFDEAIKIYRSLNDRDRLSKILINVSTYLMYKKEYERALSLLNEALELVTQTANRGVLPAIYNNIGLIYMDNRDIEKAIVNFNNALKISRNIGNKYSEMNVLVNISRAYSLMNFFKEAETYLIQSLELAKKVGNRATEGIALANLAFTYYVDGKLAKAEEAAREAIFVFEELKDTYSIVDLCPTFIDTLISREKYDEALIELKKYEELSQKLNIREGTFYHTSIRYATIFYLKNEPEKCRETLLSIGSVPSNAYLTALLLLLKYLTDIDISEVEFTQLSRLKKEPYVSIYGFLKGVLDKASLLSILDRHPHFRIFSVILKKQIAG